MYELFSLDNTLFTLWEYPVSVLELWATLITLLSVVLARLNSAHNFTTGIIGCIGFGALFFQIQLYSDFLLQGFYIATSIYGWFLWNRKGDDELKISSMGLTGTAVYGMLFLVLSAVLAALIDPIMSTLVFAFDGPNAEYVAAALPFRDAFTTVFSIGAFMLMLSRVREAWLFWIAVNVFCIWNYHSQGVILLTVEYAIFLVNAVWAYFVWGKLCSHNTESA